MADLSALGEGTFGVWSRIAALEAATPGEVDGFVRRREWQRPWPGVYADAGVQLDAVQRAIAAVIASGGESTLAALDPSEPTPWVRLRAVVAGRSAARVYKIALIDDDDPATGAQEHLVDEVLVCYHGRTLRHVDASGRTRMLQRRRARLGAGDVWKHPSGLWALSPARTLLDLSGRIADDALVCAVDDALHREVVTSAELARVAGSCVSHRQRELFAAAVDRSDGRAESPGESLTRLLLQPDLPGLEPQVRVVDAAGRLIARYDLGDDALRLCVEFDGRANHEGELMVAKDRLRDSGATGRGWTTERVTWFEVRRRREATRRRVLATAERLERQRRAAG